MKHYKYKLDKEECSPSTTGDNMRVENMTSARGNPVPNQFIITDWYTETFQSYNSTIAIQDYRCCPIKVTLDRDAWDYSVTTGRYRNQFLGETKAETQAKINSGEYQLANLN